MQQTRARRQSILCKRISAMQQLKSSQFLHILRLLCWWLTSCYPRAEARQRSLELSIGPDLGAVAALAFQSVVNPMLCRNRPTVPSMAGSLAKLGSWPAFRTNTSHPAASSSRLLDTMRPSGLRSPLVANSSGLCTYNAVGPFAVRLHTSLDM